MTSDPEYLDSHDDGSGSWPRTDLGDDPGPPRRRTGWIVGGAVAVLAVVGVGGWAAWSFFSTGAQPAEALPASTVAYASIDLDPSGTQKIEALRTLQQFPAFRDQIGLDTDGDVRERIFQAIQDSGSCSDLDFGDDIVPWLGDRMAVAAVDTGAKEPAAVLVLQVSDEDAADQGLQALHDCAGDDSTAAWSIHDGWALVGESQDVVDQMADDAAKTPLSADTDYQHWTDEAGGGGIATIYVSPAAGDLIADQIESATGGAASMGLPAAYHACAAPCSGAAVVDADPTLPPTITDALKDFQGMAATVRFHDGALELEVAADAGSRQSALAGSTGGDDMVASLPDDTAMALGVGFTEGWLSDAVDPSAMRELSKATGLDLPADAETLMGRSAALAVGSDIDPDVLDSSTDGSDVPIALKVRGDAGAIGEVVDGLGGPFETDSSDDVVVVGADADYRSQLLDDGDLGSSQVFQRALPDAADASAVMFVNFDAGDWVDRMAGDDQDVADNLAPLQALGMSTTTRNDITHVLLRITTD